MFTGTIGSNACRGSETDEDSGACYGATGKQYIFFTEISRIFDSNIHVKHCFDSLVKAT